jgi:serine/threonine protein kinase
MRDIKGFKKSDSISNFYDIQSTIGHGSFGEVLKAQHLLTNQTWAIKVIEKSKVAEHEILMQLQQ